ncbi:MAG TPA: hypothetical protein V6D14_21150 [Coleofasciculaceae cyanobacterium]
MSANPEIPPANTVIFSQFQLRLLLFNQVMPMADCLLQPGRDLRPVSI